MKRFMVLWTVLMILALPQTFAAEDQHGSVTVRMCHQGEAIQGGSIILYRLAELSGEDRYIPAPAFEGCAVDFQTTLTPADGKILADYAEQRGIQGQIRSLGQNGTAVFSPLDRGLYLLVQKEAGRGYLPVSPFFVEVPQCVGGERIHDVEARPKCTPEPMVPGVPLLPQTGQRKWPVPLMAALGLILCLVGGVRYIRSGKNDDGA